MRLKGIFIILLVLLLAPTAYGGLSWKIESVTSEGSYNSIAIDSNNRPHICYHDSTHNPFPLKYASWEGTGWHTTVLDSAYRSGYWPDIAADNNNLLHISYSQYNFRDLKYAYFNGTSWSVQDVDTTPSWCGDYTSIAVDSNNKPHISYKRYDGNELRYASWEGSSWNIQTIDTCNAYTSIAIDSNNQPHISYDSRLTSDLMYASWEGSSWNIQTVEAAGSIGLYSSIALDENNRPHISYYDSTNTRIKYASWEGSSWNIQTVEATSTSNQTSIALDNNNQPRIVSYAPGSVRYASWEAGSWAIQIVDTSGSNPHLALDTNDTPHISYSRSDGLKHAVQVMDSIPPLVTVEAPDGGEIIMGTTTYEVKWQATDDIGLKTNPITIQYTTNEGVSWQNLSSNEANGGVYIWQIPDIALSQEARIKIIAEDSGGLIGSDESDATFTLDPAPFIASVEAPNDPEFLRATDSYNILWNATGGIDYIDIFYTTGETWLPLALGEPNDGVYPWTVPNVITTEGKVRIQAVSIRGIATDESDNKFTITEENVFTVTTTLDSGAGSLRSAITGANNNGGIDIIQFNILSAEAIQEGSAYWWSIKLSSNLPYITEAVYVKGSSQPTNEVNNPYGPEIEIRGITYGLRFNTSNCTVEGLIIGDCSYGIYITDSSNEVIGNYIGTDHTGTASLSNGIGVYISALSNQSAFNKIERNLISGNSNYGIEIMDPDSSSNEVKGNYIGTDINGTTALGNGQHGVYIYYRTFDNYIGGSLSGEGNVISGNIDAGIFIEGGDGQPVNNKIIGNYIGTDVYGTAVISNEVGVQIEDGFGTIIGGTIEAEGNIISGNRQYGIGIYHDAASSGPGNAMQWNYIGTNANNDDLGNATYGIYIYNSDNVRLGPNNIIAYNNSDGIHITETNADHNSITRNSIYSNDGLGIKLVNGANDEITAPTILTAIYNVSISSTEVTGEAAGNNATVEVFSTNGPDPSGSGEGKVYLGSTIADASGNWVVTLEALTVGTTISATTTHTDNNTSMFSINEEVSGVIVEIVSLSISREANDLIISWTTSPESGAVDIYRIATTDATANIYTNEATPAWVMIITGETFSSTKEINEIGAGYAQAYYKVISTGITDSFATAEAVGKFNKAVPVGLSLFSVPLLLTDSDINVAIGDQLSNNDVIYYFTGTAWQDSTTNGSTWTGGVTDIYPDLGYWVRVQAIPTTVTVWGDVYNAASREVSLASGLNLKGTAYPIRVTLEDSDLGAALSYGSGADTGTLYYFTGSAWQDSSWNGSSWYNKGIGYFYPTRGYWIRRNNSAGSTWYYPRLY